MSAVIPVLVADHRADPPWDWDNNPDLWIYRDRTIALLRRYLHLSVEAGRLPSLLGREFFRSRITSYQITTFEDSVIFVHDVERSIARLDEFSQQLIARVVLQEYTECEASRLLHCSVRTVERLLPEALDQLSSIFLSTNLIRPYPGNSDAHVCQAEEMQQSCPSACRCRK